MKYRVQVSIKDGVLDPEMETLQRLLKRSGVKGIRRLAHTESFDIDFEDGMETTDAERIAAVVAGDILANPEIHDWTIQQS